MIVPVVRNGRGIVLKLLVLYQRYKVLCSTHRENEGMALREKEPCQIYHGLTGPCNDIIRLTVMTRMNSKCNY